MKEIRVTFEPSGRSIFVLPGTKVIEAAGRAGIALATPCGGMGTCGKCKVRITRGLAGAEPSRTLTAADIAEGHRLACATPINSDMFVEIPEESRFEHRPQILTGDSGHSDKPDPVVRKQLFSLPEPSPDDQRPDLVRLQAALGEDLCVPHTVLKELPSFLRTNRWSGTAVTCDHTILGLEAGDTRHSLYAVAFDLGTTTVVGTLLDLVTGREVAVASALNGQVAYGDDVISRIMRIRENPEAIGELQAAAAETLDSLITELVNTSGRGRTDIYEVAVAGNSTMQEILCGLDPSSLGEIPFVQVFDCALDLPASSIGLQVHPLARAFIFPQVGGFVGGDTVAGMLASALDRWEAPVLFIDIGTNGEIVLAVNGRMLAASTAAGPAFEGARIRQGMRATASAIEKVVFDDDVTCNVIGNVKPAGLCGTALIDAAAELLRCGILDPTGRILGPDDIPETVPDSIRRRLVPAGEETNFMLVDASESAGGEPIYLWQRDIRELQLAVGAIRAGTSILLKRAGVSAGQLEAVLLAGAFGNFIRRNNAQRIGLLPDVPCHAVRFIGNAASLGAKLALLSQTKRAYASDLSRRTEHIDLSRDTDFQMEFAAAMLFPESATQCDER
jgi:uncharacterized 2Fe-2S/4Fe-4S cluster protein (DUF4445 family)